ncbi:FadD3 family acyl-CoA ligase [uncultured Sphingomonas sp.]|uniref:FadD3 family acyl-CoA ligase n=1 Tax=uncultured Sphingomonas sp. TaxID=158754 RepID=UPI002631404E|nr:FadD3 family acyl-CoA ligase [uncultured Sphingomonas sp.]
MALPPTIPHLAAEAAARFGDRPALLGDDENWSFAELWRRAREAASAFLAQGVVSGERIAIWAPNRREWIVATIGAQTIGAAIVPLNTRLKGREAGDILRRTGARLLFTVGDFLGVDYPTLLADEALPDLERTILFDRDWDAFLAQGAGADDPRIAGALAALGPDTLSDIMFTSGTTGTPKGVLTTHGRIIPMFSAWGDAVGLCEGDIYLIVNPFFHSFGFKAGWVAALIAGATIVPMATFDVARMIEHIERDRISFLPGPPTIFQSLLAARAFDSSSLRCAVTGAATVPPILIERMQRELGFQTVVTAYGMTECSAITSCRQGDPVELVASSCGKALPGLEVKCADDAGREVARGQEGEVLVRGYGVMLGYLADASATAEAIDPDGWFHTGDVGVMDAGGYLRITDRKKDMYISGGFNCYPAEIEKLLSAHPAIGAVAVIGVPDERMGEIGHAFVVPRPGAMVDSDTLIGWARENMANYKAPRRITLLDALPLNASGKVVKPELRAMAERGAR